MTQEITCSHCGAPRESFDDPKCKYCGTLFDKTGIEDSKDKVFQALVGMENTQVSLQSAYDYLSVDAKKLFALLMISGVILMTCLFVSTQIYGLQVASMGLVIGLISAACTFFSGFSLFYINHEDVKEGIMK